MSLLPKSIIDKILLYNIHPVAELFKKNIKKAKFKENE